MDIVLYNPDMTTHAKVATICAAQLWLLLFTLARRCRPICQ
jgi:hypothetical protein